MTSLRRFASYYTRSSLPFLSGLAYGIFLGRWDHPLWMQVLAGLALVVLGPWVIQLVLTLIVDALRGVPDEPSSIGRSTTVGRPTSVGRPNAAPPRSTVAGTHDPGSLVGRLTRDR